MDGSPEADGRVARPGSVHAPAPAEQLGCCCCAPRWLSQAARGGRDGPLPGFRQANKKI